MPRYLLIAHQSSVNVYATATSLLVRKLRLGHSKRISTFAFSSSDPSRLYTATQSGTIQLWDWLEGRELRSWYAQCIIHALATSKVGSESEPLDLVYSINHKETGPRRISAHQLGLSQDADDSDLVTLRTSREPITSFKIIENGKLIIATSGTVLTLGSIDHSGQSPLSSLSYTWRDIECPEWISCIDVRTIEPTGDSKKNRSSDDQQIPRIDLVLGGLKGSLHVYDDLLGQLSRSEKRSEKGPVTNLTSRTKHWHRNAVLAVKWSLDGKLFQHESTSRP